eukprot:TRINITY_DN151_c0_g1_i1.p1 TRINITY_DN151_c0_g1~~TRINITY_DN151_c0_g1_i1.p1  ORF type:complete len:237 (-),score=26.54 TRINITY_DN151_c0_g1_i1:214-924(-)
MKARCTFCNHNMNTAFNSVAPISPRPSVLVHNVAIRATSFMNPPQRVSLRTSRRVQRPFACPSMAIGIIYSTITGNTQEVAAMCKEYLGPIAEEPKLVSDVNLTALAEFEALVVGAPTWNTDADSERTGTEWDQFLYDGLEGLDLKGISVAVFGLGDGIGYGDNFCDAIEEMHDRFQGTGAKMIGYTSTDECEFDHSKSIRDGKFLGLALDHVNAGDDTEIRVKTWCDQIKKEAGI